MNGEQFKNLCDQKGITYPTSEKAQKKIEARLNEEKKILSNKSPSSNCGKADSTN